MSALKPLAAAAILGLLGLARPALAEEAAPGDFSLLRVDLEDGFALHPWLFHEVRLDERWGILGTVHFQLPGLDATALPFAELDLGPVLHFGDLQINPALGLDVVWLPHHWASGQGWVSKGSRLGDLILQLYVLYPHGALNIESWNLFFVSLQSPARFYLGRQLVTYKVAGQLSVGPHAEEIYEPKVGLQRAALGADVGHGFRFGQLNLFLAWETQRGAMEGRLTFIREL